MGYICALIVTCSKVSVEERPRSLLGKDMPWVGDAFAPLWWQTGNKTQTMSKIFRNKQSSLGPSMLLVH